MPFWDIVKLSLVVTPLVALFLVLLVSILVAKDVLCAGRKPAEPKECRGCAYLRKIRTLYVCTFVDRGLDHLSEDGRMVSYEIVPPDRIRCLRYKEGRPCN